MAVNSCWSKVRSFWGIANTIAGRLRLAGWEAAVEVAEGVLRIEPFNPLLRTEAYRLLGAAHFALRHLGEACEAAGCAAAEAAGARYAWLEMVSLADLLRYCEAGESGFGRRRSMPMLPRRLKAVAGRLTASKEQLVGVLGQGVL